MLLELTILAILTVLNGVLAMSELAIVSSRPARLKVLADAGRGGARTALKLLENSGRFLSTVQIGITAVGVLSGAFSGAMLGARLTHWLEARGLSEALADALGFGSVVVAITYLSLIIGELVPKRVALRDPESIAVRVAPAMLWLSRLASPLVWLLDASGNFILRLIGQHGKSDEKVTQEEVKTILAEAENAGVLDPGENELITGVMRLADRSARALMTPRGEVELLHLADKPAVLRAKLKATRKSRLPVQEGETDNIIGVIVVKDVFEALVSGGSTPPLRSFVQEAPVVLDTTRALEVLRAIRASRVNMTLVFDEYGHFEGLVTANDVLEAITGVLQDEAEDEPALVRRADGSFLVSGWMPADEFADELGIPFAQEGDFETVAGFVLSTIGHLPAAGETFEKGGWRFEVVDLDGRRIDKLIVGRSEAA